MRNKKQIITGIIIAVIVMTFAGFVMIFMPQMEEEAEDENTTLEKLAYDQSGRKKAVYIKENGEYVPYLVLESDYDGNVLLLRENVLPEPMQYKPSPHGGDGEVLSGGWMHYDYGSYYEESSIDAFLRDDFLERFSPEVQEAVVDTTIEVTDLDSFTEAHWANATHMIERKVFLLSAVELGLTFSMGRCMTREGNALKYFEDTEHDVKKAYTADGEAWPYWTRTPWVWETYEVIVIGVTYELNGATADRKVGVRPAFCMGKDTAVHKESGILEDKSVYVLDLENE